MSRVMTGWEPSYLRPWARENVTSSRLAAAYFEQDKRWVTHRGTVLRVSELHRQHALRCIAFLERSCTDIYYYVDGCNWLVSKRDAANWLNEQPLYKALCERVLKGD